MTHPILAELERDASADAGALFVELAAAYFAATRSGDGPVSTPPAPPALHARLDAPLPLGGRPLADVARQLGDEILPFANRLFHPMYVGHQVSAPLPAPVWAEPVIAAYNNSMAVAEMSPGFTALERTVIRWMTELAGLGSRAGGTLTSGGTEATFAALLAARSHAIPDVWENGVGNRPPVIVCGEHAHYAVARAAGEMGLGLRNVVTVPSRDWRMDPAGLAATLDLLEEHDRRVMAVVATAGSTATGSFDDLARIADLCDARGLWLHVDGAHGASALLSPTHRHRVRGIERARSIAWDPHKMMLLPLAAGMVLVRDERDLETGFAQKAPYLFHGAADEARNWDTGVRSFQCSRRADVVKLWVALQRYGADGIGALYDHLCAGAAALHRLMGGRGDFVPLHIPECNILCFRWVGDGTLDDATVDQVNRALRPAYNASGDGWITATVLGGRPVLRVTVMNPRTTPAHLTRLLDGLAAEAARVRDRLETPAGAS